MTSSGSPTQNMSSLLTYPSSSNLLDVPLKNTYGECPIRKDGFRATACRLQLLAFPPFEDTKKDENYDYITWFVDQPEGEGIVIAPLSILRM